MFIGDALSLPVNHQDTNFEEYLRWFFTRYGKGNDLMACGRRDESYRGIAGGGPWHERQAVAVDKGLLHPHPNQAF